MKKFKTVFIILVIVGILALIKIFLLAKPEEQKPKDSKAGNNKPAVVTVYVVKSETLENRLYASGTVLPNEEADLNTERGGKIIKINFTEGNSVSKGDLLVKINDAGLQAELKKLKSQEDLAKEKEARQKKLLDINGISKEEYESSVNVLYSIRADIEMMQAQIAETEIRAPFSGTIGLKNVSEGSYVTSAVKIATIQQLDPVKIDFSIPERYAALVLKGNTIRFSVEGNNETLEAKIIAVEPGIDVATRTIKARALCENKNRKILPGAFAKIEMVMKASENSIMIPSEAVIPVLKGHKVFISKNGLAEEVKIVAGLRTENRVQVMEGLSAGDSVITTGIMQIKKGSNLKIVSVK
ncbi:MAG: efflux RND transporter periplasmic adaptor subunit [Bacteroidia bacterium]|nr:efflux RND transporter periplasmic adaptor subunit [Bacteroidia bacterium]